MVASDAYGQSTYSFNVDVFNNQPTFSGAIISNPLIVHVSMSETVSLPSYSDPDFNNLTVTATEIDQPALPAFVTFTSNTFKASPTLQSQVGTYSI